MARSCDPTVLALIGQTYQVAFELWLMFGSRGVSVLPSASHVGSHQIVFGVQHPSRWALLAFGRQLWMTITSQLMKREKG